MIYVGGILAGIILFGIMLMPAQHYVSLVGVAAVVGGGFWFRTDATRGAITVAAGIILIIVGVMIWRREVAREKREAEQTAETIRGQMNRPPPGS